MTKRELIDALAKVPDNATVYISSSHPQGRVAVPVSLVIEVGRRDTRLVPLVESWGSRVWVVL